MILRVPRGRIAWSKTSGSPAVKPHDEQGFVFLGETLCFWKVKLYPTARISMLLRG
jgi:hypothetical protein